MKIAIIGGRDFNDYTQLKESIKVKLDESEITHMVSGGARGADTLGETYANEKGIQKIIHYPDWEKYGRAAGFIRNKLIIDEADVVFAFWDGASKGTLSSIKLAEKAHKKLHIIRYDTPTNG